MYCTHCGAYLAEHAAFCHNCGRRAAASGAGGPAPDDQHPAARPVRIGRTPLIVVLVVVLVAAVGGGTALLMRRGATTAPPRPPDAATAPSTSPASPPADPDPSPALTPSATSPSPAAPLTFADLYRQTSNGVLRVETTACDGGGVGTGFLIAPNMVATVAHVVEGGVSIVVRQGTTTTTGTVIGIDPRADLALVRTSVPLTGHVFTLDQTQPEVGVDVGAIGYPLGGPESLTKGSVSGLGRTIDVGNGPLRGMIQTDAGINPGNSGGPLLDTSGTVVGLVDAKRTDASSIGYAIPANTAQAALESWRTSPSPVHTASHCSAPTAPDSVNLRVNDHTQHPDGPAIADAFATYANAINSGDYHTAYDQLSPHEQSLVPFEEFASGNETSFIVTMDLDTIDAAGSNDQVDVRFTSVQSPSMGHNGQTCSEWTMTYTLTPSAGSWLIDRAQPHPGSPNPC